MIGFTHILSETTHTPFQHPNLGCFFYHIPALSKKMTEKLEKMEQVRCKWYHFLHRFEKGNRKSHTWVWHFLMFLWAIRPDECPQIWPFRWVVLLREKLKEREKGELWSLFWCHSGLSHMLILLFPPWRDGCFKWWPGEQWPFQRHREHHGGPHAGLLGNPAIRCCSTPHSVQPEPVDTAEYWRCWKPEGRWVELGGYS